MHTASDTPAAGMKADTVSPLDGEPCRPGEPSSVDSVPAEPPTDDW